MEINFYMFFKKLLYMINQKLHSYYFLMNSVLSLKKVNYYA